MTEKLGKNKTVRGPSLSTCSLKSHSLIHYRVQAFASSTDRQRDVRNLTFTEQINQTTTIEFKYVFTIHTLSRENIKQTMI